MNTGYYTRDELAAVAALRPVGYLDELMRAAVAEDGATVTFDKDHPAYVALRDRYAGHANIEVWRDHEIVVDPDTLAPLNVAADPAEWGPDKWAQIHDFCLRPEARDPAALAAFVAGWRKSIPPFGCSCAADLAELLEQHPPDAAEPFAWSVALHNWVNAKLGKPQMTLAEARGRWDPGGE